MGGKIFFRGSYSEDQIVLMERLLTKDSVFLDVGANQGEFSIAAARIARKVLAFEPVSEYRQRLFTNIRLNQFENVQVYPFALSDGDGSLPIYDQNGNFSDGTRHEGLPTLFPSAARDEAREVVPVRRMDDVLREADVDRVDLIKLDIEGAEWVALRGAAETIRTYHPILILEIGRETCQAAGYEPEQLVDWLRSMNYRVERIGYRGRTLPIEGWSLDEFQNVIAVPV
jgi:FkbM family methyltransferase